LELISEHRTNKFFVGVYHFAVLVANIFHFPKFPFRDVRNFLAFDLISPELCLGKRFWGYLWIQHAKYYQFPQVWGEIKGMCCCEAVQRKFPLGNSTKFYIGPHISRTMFWKTILRISLDSACKILSISTGLGGNKRDVLL
jgi:hypothetical protein